MEFRNPSEVIFQRRCTNFVYVTPVGLRELMSDITREVLRCQPKEIYMFIANYLESLIITRENMRVACGLVQQVVDSGGVIGPLLKTLKITSSQATEAAKIIQRAFRKYARRKSGETELANADTKVLIKKLLRKCNLTLEEASGAARIIQRAFRTYRYSLEKQAANKFIRWNRASRTTISLLKKLQARQGEKERAATLIKAAYKGYYTRRLLKNIWKQPVLEKMKEDFAENANLESARSKERQVEQNVETEEMGYSYDYDKIINLYRNEAAIVIQRTFRRYLRRRNLENSQLQDAFDSYPLEEKFSRNSIAMVIMGKDKFHKLNQETRQRVKKIFQFKL